MTRKKHIDRHFNKLYLFINRKELTPAANLVKGSSVILQSKPELADKIISKLLKIRINEYETKECKEIFSIAAIARTRVTEKEYPPFHVFVYKNSR